MFTGIIDHCGLVISSEANSTTRKMWINCKYTDLILGESIAVNGICLTVTDIQATAFSCDISSETETVTTTNTIKAGQQVNLERALQLSTRLGGHMVSGHVDQVIALNRRQHLEGFIEMTFRGVNDDNIYFLMKKGSIAINGVSLTINSVFANEFTVMLIPHTLLATNLASLNEYDQVNVEFDMIAKMIFEQHKKYITKT